MSGFPRPPKKSKSWNVIRIFRCGLSFSNDMSNCNQPAMNSGEYENTLIELPSWSKIDLAFQEQFDAASSALV